MLMLVGGALLGLNLHQTRYVIDYEDKYTPPFTFVFRGWPLRYLSEHPEEMETVNLVFSNDNREQARRRQEGTLLHAEIVRNYYEFPNNRNWDIALNTAILLTILFLCEWRVRRKERTRVLNQA